MSWFSQVKKCINVVLHLSNSQPLTKDSHFLGEKKLEFIYLYIPFIIRRNLSIY